MTPRQLQALVRARGRALRERLGASQRRLRQRVDALPQVQAERRKRRRRRALTAAVLALLLLFLRCDCQPGPGAPPPDAGRLAEGAKQEVAPGKAPRPRPLQAKVTPQPRPGFSGEAPTAPNWLDDFRLQVAARSPRLAACFSGSERPGALRWTAAVDAHSGAVADHLLEPLGAGGALERAQRDCAVKALSAPPYRLPAGDGGAGPSRVSLVIEF